MTKGCMVLESVGGSNTQRRSPGHPTPGKLRPFADHSDAPALRRGGVFFCCGAGEPACARERTNAPTGQRCTTGPLRCLYPLATMPSAASAPGEKETAERRRVVGTVEPPVHLAA